MCVCVCVCVCVWYGVWGKQSLIRILLLFDIPVIIGILLRAMVGIRSLLQYLSTLRFGYNLEMTPNHIQSTHV